MRKRSRRHRLAHVQWARRQFFWRCVDWNSVSFSGETVTRFALCYAGGKRTNKRCWDCYVLERDRFGGDSFVVWGGKMGDQKTYFDVMQDNFNALYRRRLVCSCHTISPLFLHIKIEVIFGIWNKLKQNKKSYWMQCIFVLSFLKGVDILS